MAKILIIDDNEEIANTLKQLFQFHDFQVETALNGKLGLEKVHSFLPDLIILDALMPVMDGFETIKRLKDSEMYNDIPVIFLSANYTEEEHKIIGLELGADDYLLKPFNTKELITKVKALLQRKYLIDSLKNANLELLKNQQRLKKEVESIKASKSEEANLFLDPDTGIYNVAYFKPRLKEEIERCKRYDHDLSMILISIDNMKQIVEMCNEAFVSYLIMKIANILLQATRTTDILCRLDEKRFAVILPHTDESGAFYEAERIRSVVTRKDLFVNIVDEVQGIINKKIKKQELYCSSAVIQYDKNEKLNGEEYFKKALEFLNHIVEKGGNRTVRYLSKQNL